MNAGPPRVAPIPTSPDLGPRTRSRAGDRPPGERASLLGQHPRMRQVRERIERVGRDQATVLVRGESGTGKELAAEAIHEASPRAARPLVKVNCGALTDTLLASTLFGHERGAFTGAVERARGCFEAASGGTLFLDEIGDISPRAQVALLRVLEERRIQRVGGASAIAVDARVVCATNRPLEGLVERGVFREDLYYRLQAIQIVLPPLREHPEDIPAIARHLLERAAAQRGVEPSWLDDGAATRLAIQRWPGNVRQLDNVLRAASLFADGRCLTARDIEENGGCAEALPVIEASPTVSSLPWDEVVGGRIGLRQAQKQLEVMCLRRALEMTAGNIARAAALLKMKRPRVSQLVKAHGIPARAYSELEVDPEE